MKDIALTATGYSATSDEGKAVIAVIEDPKFANTILDSYGAPDPKKKRKDRVAPWNMSSGGFEDQTERVLQGGEPSIDNMLGTTGLLTSRSGRTKENVATMGPQCAERRATPAISVRPRPCIICAAGCVFCLCIRWVTGLHQHQQQQQ